MIFVILEQSSLQKYTTCWVFLALRHMLYLCVCVFLYLYFCICMFDTREYHFWYPWTILFSKICHMMGLYGTVNMLYLCICVFVFVYLCMRHLVISVLISLDQELSENVWFVWSKTSYSGDVTMRDVRTTTNDDKQGKIMLLSLWMLEGWVSQYHQIHSYQPLLKSVTTAYGFGTFLQTPYSTLNDENEKDYMINWPYFSNEISSKSTVTASLQKCDHCVWIRDFSADPLIAHSMMNMTMIIWSTDHIFLMKYHQNPQ